MSTAADAPPSAEIAGRAIRRRSRNCPISISRRASRPVTKKKKVIRPSLIQWRRSWDIPLLPIWMDSLVVHKDSYELDQGELAHIKATSTAPKSTAAPPVSVVRKSRTGVARLRAQAVRSVKVEDRGASEPEAGDSPSICMSASLVDQRARARPGLASSS